MATSPPLPSPKPGTASPNDSLRRDASKKEGVKGWMGTLTRRKKTDEGIRTKFLLQLLYPME